MATFGKTTKGANLNEDSSPSQVFGCIYTAPQSGTITKLSLYCQCWGGGPPYHLSMAVYSDNGGVPNALLATSSELDVYDTFLVWRDFTISLAITAGTKYWFFWECGAEIWYMDVYYDNGSSCQGYYGEPGAFPNFPYPFNPDGCSGDYAVSVYATYTPAPPAAPKQGGGGPILWFNKVSWAGNAVGNVKRTQRLQLKIEGSLLRQQTVTNTLKGIRLTKTDMQLRLTGACSRNSTSEVRIIGSCLNKALQSAIAYGSCLKTSSEKVWLRGRNWSSFVRDFLEDED